MDKSLEKILNMEIEKYYFALVARALRSAPRESDLHSPVQGDFNAETLVSITIENLIKHISRHGMPNHFWAFTCQQMEWVRCTQYRKMKKREELFFKEFGNLPVDLMSMNDHENNRES